MSLPPFHPFTKKYYSLLTSIPGWQDIMPGLEQRLRTINGGMSAGETSDSDLDSISGSKGKSPVETSDSDFDDSFSPSHGKPPAKTTFAPRRRRPRKEDDNSNAFPQRRREDYNYNNGGGGGCMLDLSLGSLSSSHEYLQNNNTITLPPLSDLPDQPVLQRQSLSPPPEFSALPLLPSSPLRNPMFIARPPPLARLTTKKKPPASSPLLRVGKSETITPPYEWATNRRAGIHTLDYLQSKQITTITGDVVCRRCEAKYKVEFDLREKFGEVAAFIWENRAEMAERAPDVWKNPTLLPCSYCRQENSAKPVIGSSKKAINWLFLLLGQMLGCCTLDQLRYFCKHTRNHRTGAKDRVLYLAYLNLCKQLDPYGPFDR